jgi:hypothetical protein
MMNNDYYFATMTVTEFRAFRKALTILMRAYIPMNEAVNMLLTARQDTIERRSRVNSINDYVSAK